jgi:hypothetical protein
MNQEFPPKRPFPEHWLHWTLQSPELLKQPLHTIDNQTIKIIDPGRINYDNGPDILNAILEIGGILQKGNIEFHLSPEDWFGHGHHEDRRYENLILHVLWDAPNGIESMLLRRFPHLILSSQIRIPLADWKEKMTLLEQNGAGQSPNLFDATSITTHQLRECAQLRFERKVERFKSWLAYFSFEDILIIALAEALGYSKNKFPFRQLIWENPPSTIFPLMPKSYRSPLGVWTYLAMRAGFLSSYSFTQKGMDRSSTVFNIHNLFLFFSDQGVVPILQLKDWYFSRLRPSNNPTIRLVALSQIIHHYYGTSLFTKMQQCATERLTLRKLLPKWQAYVQLPFDRQLINAVREMNGILNKNRYIIGLNRINQFIVNSVLPILFLWAERSRNYGFQCYIEGIYEDFPACEDSKVIQETASKFPDRSLSKLAIYQQGLYELLAKTTIQSQRLFEPRISFG